MKRRKRKSPPRYLLTWSKQGSQLPDERKWNEKRYARIPKHLHGWALHQPIRCEDLLHETVIHSNFDLRQDAYFVTQAWPLREKALAALKRHYAKPTPNPSKEGNKTVRRAKRLAALLARQKNWQRKARLAQTKLRKLNKQIKSMSKIKIKTDSPVTLNPNLDRNLNLPQT